MEQLRFRRCEIKSKYFSEWQSRTITLNPAKNILGISHQDGQVFKYFKLSQIKMQQKTGHILNIQVSTNRIYEVKGRNIGEILEAVRSHKILSELGNYCEMKTISKPKSIDYSKFILNSPVASMKSSQIMSKKSMKPEKEYKRQKSYYKEIDWALNLQEGGLILVSEEKKKNQGKIIKFVLKKFITTGAFMGISFPVFAMKPESILQTYCKSIAAAPIIFDEYKRCPVQRMKKFVCFCFTFSRLFTDMDKPFNPTLGQTFQAEIAGGTYSAEQTSHHPPQSSIYFQGKGYKIYATLELVAQIGLNSASGMVQGDLIIEFEQGGKIIGRTLQGEMTGFIMGENKFRPDGSCYSYDPENNLVCSYKRTEMDLFRGHIGELKGKASLEFQKTLKSKQRFTDFSAFQRTNFTKIQSNLQACWSHYVKFDQSLYFDFNNTKLLPYEPSSEGISLLQSDSRHRQDIKLRAQCKFDESQQEKERIEEQERIFRKLRTNYAKKNQNKKN